MSRVVRLGSVGCGFAADRRGPRGRIRIPMADPVSDLAPAGCMVRLNGDEDVMAGNDSFEIRCSTQMLPAMLHGLAIARNSAMISSSPAVMEEFQAMLDSLARQCGVPNLLRVVNEYKWYDACAAMRKAGAYHWYVQDGERDWGHPDRPRKPGNVSLVVDGREYPLEHRLSEAEPHIAAIREMVEMYAAVDAIKGPDERGWRSCSEALQARRAEARAAAAAAVDADGGHEEPEETSFKP